MAGSGSLRSRNLRDMKDTFDSLREMIRELKRGRRRLRSQINVAIRKLDEIKNMRDELNELSSTIRNYNHIQSMQHQMNADESVTSVDVDMVHLREEVAPTNSLDDVNVFSQEKTLRISVMSTGSVQSSVESFDILEEEFYSPMHTFGSSEDEVLDAGDDTDCSKSSEDEFLDVDDKYDCEDYFNDEFLDVDDEYECNVYSKDEHPDVCNEHEYSDFSKVPRFSGNSQDQKIISLTDKNTTHPEEEDIVAIKEDVTAMWTNECKKRKISILRIANSIENPEEGIMSSITNQTFTNKNYEPLKREEFDCERISFTRSSITSNANFSYDPSLVTMYSMRNPVEWCYIETVTDENSKFPKREDYNSKEERSFAINAYTETCFSEDAQRVVPCISNETLMTFDNAKSGNETITDDVHSSKLLQKEELDSISKSFSLSSKSPKLNFSESHSEKMKQRMNIETVTNEIEKALEKEQLAGENITCFEKEGEIDSYERSLNSSRTIASTEINCGGNSREEITTNVAKIEDDNSILPQRGEVLDFEKENLRAAWVNSNDGESVFRDHKNQMTENEEQRFTRNFYQSQKNHKHLDKENDKVSASCCPNFGSLMNNAGNLLREIFSSECICDCSEGDFDEFFNLNETLDVYGSNSHPKMYSTNHCNDTNLQEIYGAAINDNLCRVKGNIKDFDTKNKSQTENEIKSFPETNNLSDHCDRAERIKNPSESSTDRHECTEVIFANLDDQNALTGSLRTRLLPLTLCPSHEDILMHDDVAKTSPRDSVPLETENIISVNHADENQGLKKSYLF